MSRSIQALLVVVFAGFAALVSLSAVSAEDQSKITTRESAFYPSNFHPALAEGVVVGSGGIFGKGTTGTAVIADGVPGFVPCGQLFCDNGQDVYTFPTGTLTVAWQVVMHGIDPTATSAYSFTFMGTWSIQSGTGVYAGAQGSGKVDGPCLSDVTGNSVCLETRTGRMQIEH